MIIDLKDNKQAMYIICMAIGKERDLIDKIFLYPIFGKKRTHQFHRKHVKHHFDNAKNTKYRIQMIIDWECARYTKPDKPLSAYGFMMAAHPEAKNELLPLMKQLGMER